MDKITTNTAFSLGAAAHHQTARAVTHLLPMSAFKGVAHVLYSRLLLFFATILVLSLWELTAHAAVPGISGTSTPGTFELTASADYVTAPDGAMIYTWGYGCSDGSSPSFLPAASSDYPSGNCSLMQLPGPTLIVQEGATVSVTLTNRLPVAAGNTSILFPGFDVTPTGGVAGQLTREAAPGGTVSYSFIASKPGTYSYYSGTRSDLQIEMGLYGALIVLPATSTGCVQGAYSLAASAYSDTATGINPTCYDREYLMELSEMDLNIHQQVQDQMDGPGPVVATMEPYVPQYFWYSGRSFPDNVDTPYSPVYFHQPYSFAPQIHPGERMLVRVVQHGRVEHPLHIHGNHARILARDGNLLLSASDPAKLAGALSFTFTAAPGQTLDSIFTWTGKGLGWDMYSHSAADATHPCYPDASGYYTKDSNPPAPLDAENYGEWCADHGKPIPVTPPDPSIVANGQFYGGSPYLGFTGVGQQTLLAPGVLKQNPGAAYCYPWHSHHEREITTNNVFPGGIMTVMCVIPPSLAVVE
jgi:FtsP/CotA-like multicopper oxidase with cupredoxin domain